MTREAEQAEFTNSGGAAEASTTAEDYTCPIPTTHDKFREAHYFISRIFDEFHEPAPFRWNLNAFLQALRSVPEMTRAELGQRPGFEQWWEAHLEEFQEAGGAVLRQACSEGDASS